jgi:hypothetical protein
MVACDPHQDGTSGVNPYNPHPKAMAKSYGATETSTLRSAERVSKPLAAGGRVPAPDPCGEVV